MKDEAFGRREGKADRGKEGICIDPEVNCMPMQAGENGFNNDDPMETGRNPE